MVLPWLWARPVDWIRCFLHLFMYLRILLGVVWCRLEFCVCVWLEGGRGVLILCLHLVSVLFFNEYVGCILKSVLLIFCCFGGCMVVV